MAVQKAYNCNLKGTTIDANEDNSITWQVSGDIQTAFQVDIYLNSDNSLKFTSNKISSYALKYTLPHGSLPNGNEYKIKITIFNASNQSIQNDGDIFQTSSRPVVTVDTIGTVGSFSYNFTAEYSQAENVTLRNYVANLYDSNKNLLNTSGIQTSTPLQYLFDELQSETSYYIEFQATSSKGLTGTSGLISFSVFYYRPKQNVQLEAKNIDQAGIELTWFVRQIIGSSDTTVNFINNEEVDLTNGNKIYFQDGFSIDQDFSLKLWLRDVSSGVPLITLNGVNGQIVLKYNAIQQMFVVEKTIGNIVSRYIYSAQLTTNSQPVVLIQQIDLDMNLSVTV